MPHFPASHSTEPTKSRCSISRMNVIASPPLPQPKQWKNPSSSLTLNDPVFSAWNGHNPTHRRPTRLSCTYCDTTSRRFVASRTRTMSSSTIPTTEDRSGRSATNLEDAVERCFRRPAEAREPCVAEKFGPALVRHLVAERVPPRLRLRRGRTDPDRARVED